MFSTSWEEAAPVVPFIQVLLELPEMNIWIFVKPYWGFVIPICELLSLQTHGQYFMPRVWYRIIILIR